MGAKCPSCSAAIEELPGFVTQAKLEERLKNQKDGFAPLVEERDALKVSLSAAQTKAGSFDAVAAERDRLAGEIKSMQLRGERTAALAKNKIPDTALPHIEQVYQWATAGQENPPAFDAWLDAPENGARAHPLAAHFFAAAGVPPVVPKPTNTLPDPAAGAGRTPPVPGARITENDTGNFLRSPAYLALPIADRVKALDAHEAEVAAQARQIPA